MLIYQVLLAFNELKGGVKMSIMTCTNPTYLAVYLEYKHNKRNVEIISRDRYLKNKSNPLIKYYKTRCRKCLACKLHKGYEWSNRLLAESYTSNISYFITFTFADDHLPDIDTLEETSIMRPIQLFMKRLRKRYQNLKFKYYSVCELGGKTLRLHYHMILYSEVDIFNDKYFYKYTEGGHALYISPTLQNIWKYGNVNFNIAVHDTMKYTANYVQGKGNVLGHSYSRNIGNEYIKQMQNNEDMYIINGHFSKVPEPLKKQDKLEKYINNIKSEILKEHEEDLKDYARKARQLNKSKKFKST